MKVRRLNRKRKTPTERSTYVKRPRVKGEKVAVETLLLLSEPPKEEKTNTDDLLVAHALCSLGDISTISSANAQSNEDYKLECSVESEPIGNESERQELKTSPVQDKIQKQVNL